MNPKVIRMTEDVLIKGCRKNDRRSQRHLYEKYFETMTLVCLNAGVRGILVASVIHASKGKEHNPS